MTDPDEVVYRGAIDPSQTWTPVAVERKLSELYNAVARAELGLRQLSDKELDAKIAYERVHVITTTDPSCPKVERGGTTVAERDDWIRGVEFDDYEAYERAKEALKRARRYQERLEQQCSLMQTQAKMVALAYSMTGSGVGG